jgi:hypothetical protein
MRKVLEIVAVLLLLSGLPSEAIAAPVQAPLPAGWKAERTFRLLNGSKLPGLTGRWFDVTTWAKDRQDRSATFNTTAVDHGTRIVGLRTTVHAEQPASGGWRERTSGTALTLAGHEVVRLPGRGLARWVMKRLDISERK